MPDPIAQLKHELLAAAERQHGQPAAARAGPRRWRLWGENRLLQAAAAVAIVAAAVLFVASPWKSSPGFLERAEAALTPPVGSVLHMKWETTTTSKDFSCSVTRGPEEIWIDQTPPHRYRGLMQPPPDPVGLGPRALACSRGEKFELGGTLDAGPTLWFVPPNTLTVRQTLILAPDPVAALREAIDAGRAHQEGPTQLDGRTVERIRIDPARDCPIQGGCGREYVYVDTETYHPVQTESPNGYITLPGQRLRFDVVQRYQTFEYLPRTAANLALSDIRAQHPDATESWGAPGLAIHVPDAKTVRAAKGAQSARVTFEVTATDDEGGGDFPVSCSPRSGSRFPLGETTVQCAATGSNGSAATAAFTVTVKR